MVATVRRPAPDFSGEVVESGEFKETSLAAYAGKWCAYLQRFHFSGGGS